MKKYKVFLTEKEMQMVANGIAAFYNVANREKININPEQTALIANVMEKFKKAVDSGPDNGANIVLIK